MASRQQAPAGRDRRWGFAPDRGAVPAGGRAGRGLVGARCGMKLRRLTLPGLATFCFAVAACGAAPEQARPCGLTVGAFAEGDPAEPRAETIDDGTAVLLARVNGRSRSRVESTIPTTGSDRHTPPRPSPDTDG